VFGLPLAPWFLRAICPIPSFGISKFAANVWFSRYQQKCQQNGRLERIFACGFNASRKYFPRIWKWANALSYCYY
jgi:hypothetical protein